MHTYRMFTTLLCMTTALCLQAQNKYKNPVFNEDTPDPTVVRATDGTFYAYGTGGTCRKSSDLAHWSNVGNALARPTWNDSTYIDSNGSKKTDYYSLWALDVSRTIDDKYLVYYACALWGNGTRTGIGVATGSSPTKFTDKGKLFRSTEIGVHNSIDPCYVEEFDKKYLVWGSFNDLYISELTDDGLAIKDFKKKTKLAGGAFEGVMIYKRNGYYYLFASVGSCCEGVNSTYRTVVGRSQNLMGPYVNRQGGSMVNNNYTTIIQGNDAWKGPGHNSEIITDDAGQDWLLYHAYSATTPNKGRVLMLDKITWSKDGWPSVGNGTPSVTEQDAPVFYKTNGADITYKFKNTDLSKSEWKGWKVDKKSDTEMISGKGTAFMPLAFAYEGADFDVSQSETKLANGIYEVHYNGFSTAGTVDCYVNNIFTPVYNPTLDNKTPATTERILSNQILRGYYEGKAYGFVTDGKLTFGMRSNGPLATGERFCMSNVKVIYREKDRQAQTALWNQLNLQAEKLAASDKVFYKGYISNLESYRENGQNAEDSLVSYKNLLATYLTFDSINTSIDLYDSLRIATTTMQNQIDSATKQGYVSDEAKSVLAEAQLALDKKNYANTEVETLISKMTQAIHNMEYAYQQGDGTQDNPYVIMRPAQLDHMHDVLIKEQMVYFVLGADIDMNGYVWKQLNTSENSYKYRVNLDGRGHIISNLTPDGSKYNPSFFGVLCGECRNVGFLNVTVNSETSCSGILCGTMGHSSFKDADGNLLPVIVENCYFQGSVSGKGYLGALGGTLSYSPVTIRNCYSNVNVQGTASVGSYAGGMIGRVRSALTIEKSYAAGNVYAYTSGGIIGGGQNNSTPASLYNNVIAWNNIVDGNNTSEFGNLREEDIQENTFFSDQMKVNEQTVQGGYTTTALQQVASSWGTPWHSDPTVGNGFPILEWQYQRGDYRQKCGFPLSTGIISSPSEQDLKKQATYDLQGRQVTNPSRGIYIIDGKKILIR